MVYGPISTGPSGQLSDKVTGILRRAYEDVSARFARNTKEAAPTLVDVLDDHADTLERRHSLFNAAVLEQTDIVIYAPDHLELTQPLSTLKSIARTFKITPNKSFAESAMMASSARHRILVFANVTDAHDAVDWLLRVRMLDPEIAIIITSPEFSSNDLSTARGRICDASLRQPYTTVSLAMGVTAALNNNREIRMRGGM